MGFFKALVLAMPCLVTGSFFGPPKFVTEACEKWCAASADDSDAKDACDACHEGPQVNPKCADGADCNYCDKNIVFPRHYPKLWREEPKFKSDKLEGKTRCWCDTGCPVYAVKSWLFCHADCSKVCSNALKGSAVGPDVEVV
eukprot:TRINITY_DN42748_c0_g1_i1.p1 TRINITY_DN42748_c0_g1~~TRINITY_DN42748_c0_g1_i1.p1  ORF type:complete len:163 (-),score=29.05 TRINITY_DN42748_c0_g1_i1:207-632(-)